MSGDNDQQQIKSTIVTLDSDGNLILNKPMGASYAGRQVRLDFELFRSESDFRGSRKHILNLLDSPRCAQTLQGIIGIDGIQLADNPYPKPIGHQSVNETDLDDYIRQYRAEQWPAALQQLNAGKWWSPNGGTRPQMDLICGISVGGKAGLLFVEAKAHEGELDWGGKLLADNASDGSLQNHENIRQQIQIASKGLNAVTPGFNLSINSHYQLVNRLTYLWKLASLDIPVVLMYLGFTTDTYFDSDYLRDDRHWQRIMGGYLQGVVPHGFPEKEFSTGNGTPLRMIIRSCDISFC